MKIPKLTSSSEKSNTARSTTAARNTASNPILQMQSLVGNRAATQFLRQQVLQTMQLKKPPKTVAKPAEEPQVQKGAKLLSRKQELTDLQNSLGSMTDDAEIQEIVDRLENYETLIDEDLTQDIEAADVNDVGEISDLQAEVLDLLTEVKAAADNRVEAIKDVAWAAWQNKINSRQAKHQQQRNRQQQKWNQLIQFTPALAVDADYLKWLADFTEDNDWWAGLPGRDDWYPDRVEYEQKLTELEQKSTTAEYDLSMKPTQGVARKLDIQDPGHIRLHEKDDVAKYKHGIFNGNAIFMTELAWKNKGAMSPVTEASGDKYHIPFANAGRQGGMPTTHGHGSALNYVTIVTETASARVITAYPSNGP